MLLKIVSLMTKNITSNNIENEEFNLNKEEDDYKNLFTKLKEIKKTLSLLEQNIFK